MQDCLSRNAMKREEPYKYSQTFSINPGAKEKLVKKLKKKWLQLQSSLRLYVVSLIKRSNFYLNFACHVLYSHKPFVRPLRKQFIKLLTTLCRSMYSMWFCLFEKAKYILEAFLFTFWESSSGAQQALYFIRLLSPGTSWRHYMGLMAMIGNMP